MKKMLAILGLILLVAAGYVAYVFLTLDAEELGQKVLGKINESTGVQLAAEKFEVRPLHGVRLESGHLKGNLASGSVTGTLDRMVLDYELLPVLQGEVVVQGILIEGPNLDLVSRPVVEADKEESAVGSEVEGIELVETDGEGTVEAAEDESGLISAISISEMRVEEGNLRVTTAGSDSRGLAVRGFNLELGDLSLNSAAVSPLMGLRGQGQIRIDEIALEAMEIRGGRGELFVDGGHLIVRDLGIETEYAGLQVAEIAADLTQDPAPYRLQVGGSYDLNRLVEAAEGDGFGPAALEFTAHGVGPDLEGMVATGTFRLDSGQIPAFPMMVKIEELLGESLIVGLPYEGMDFVFSIEGGRAEVEPFVMGFENLQMAGGGQIDFAGPIDMQIDLKLRREAVSISILDPFIDGMTDEDGWTVIPFNIAGTMAEPDVELDMTAVKETASGLGKRAVSKALEDAAESLKEKAWRRRTQNDHEPPSSASHF